MPYQSPVPIPHCPVVGGGGHHRPLDLHPSVLQLIKYQSVQSKVRLVCARENQKSLSRDFIFPSARVSGTGCAHSVSWGDMGPLGILEAANQ